MQPLHVALHEMDYKRAHTWLLAAAVALLAAWGLMGRTATFHAGSAHMAPCPGAQTHVLRCHDNRLLLLAACPVQASGFQHSLGQALTACVGPRVLTPPPPAPADRAVLLLPPSPCGGWSLTLWCQVHWLGHLVAAAVWPETHPSP